MQRLKPSLALRLLSEGLFYIRAMLKRQKKHYMTRANLNKSEWLVTNTASASNRLTDFREA